MGKVKKYMSAAERALEKAKKAGASMAEAYLTRDRHFSIEIRDGAVETMKLSENVGVGMRVIVNRRVGFAFSSDLSKEGMDDASHRALYNASQVDVDELYSLPAPVSSYPEMELYDPAMKKTKVEEKIEIAREMETTALAYDSKVKIIESSSYQDAEVEVAIINTLGMRAATKGTYCGIFLSLVAGEGEESQTGFALDYSIRFANLKPDQVGKEAARRAVRMLGARPVTSRRVTVILEPYIATMFLNLMAPALTGEAVQKGRSLFKGKVGQRVASEKVILIDDGTKPGLIGSAPFDGEGVPTSRTVLVDKGILKGFLHNSYTAAKEGLRSTGNGIRHSFKGTPEVGTTNFYIKNGTVAPEDIVKEIDEGLYITEIMGMHTANPISGDFSVGASGIWIENGEFKQPVRGIAVAGNITELLKGVDAVGNDLKFYGTKGSPTLRIKEMSLSGR